MCSLVKKNLIILLGLFCSLLAWCGDKGLSSSGKIDLLVSDFFLSYNGNVDLQKVYLNEGDSPEILDLYEETWNNIIYKDSLLIAKKFDQWLWVNSFVQQNLDSMEDLWLSLDNVNKKQIVLNKDWKNVNGVLVEYDVSEWFVSDVPLLYMSQLFIPIDNSIILFSYMTENSKARWSASKMFKNVK